MTQNSVLILSSHLKKIATLKFIYSEKVTKFCEIFNLLLTTVHRVKSKVISQNFVAFSEYMNFTDVGKRITKEDLSQVIC